MNKIQALEKNFVPDGETVHESDDDGHHCQTGCGHDHGGGGFYNQIPVKAPVLPGRNDPCYCGSGKKFKKCCLNQDEQL